jgi:hypothetical protein
MNFISDILIKWIESEQLQKIAVKLSYFAIYKAQSIAILKSTYTSVRVLLRA